MEGNKTSSSTVPSDDVYLVNKKYLDEHLERRLTDDATKIIMNNLSLNANRSGEAFTGPIDTRANKITS